MHLAIIHQADSAIIKKLLDANPNAAKIETNEKQLPFHLALSCNCKIETVKYIFEAFPEANKKCDPMLGLYPFMIPMCTSHETIQTGPKNDDMNFHYYDEIEKVQIAFDLLRKNPDNIL